MDGRSVRSIRRYNRTRGRKTSEELLKRCRTCEDVLCCRVFAVHLTFEESKRFKKDREALREQRITILALKKNKEECYYLSRSGRCRVWRRRPQACREYTCEGERRELIKLSKLQE